MSNLHLINHDRSIYRKVTPLWEIFHQYVIHGVVQQELAITSDEGFENELTKGIQTYMYEHLDFTYPRLSRLPRHCPRRLLDLHVQNLG